jgi:hypothetical protein
VIIQIALQIAQAQGKSFTGQSILQLATQITQNPNGVLAQAILQLVLQDNIGKSSQTTTIIKNVIRISREGNSGYEKPRPPNKQLALSISFAKDTIVVGNIQTITVTVSDSESNEKIQGAIVKASVKYASGKYIEELGSKTTDSSGQASFSWRIGGGSEPGTFTAIIQASASNYESAYKTTTF